MRKLLTTLACLLTLQMLASDGCASWFSREPPRPGKTTLKSPLVSLPAQVINNYFIISTKVDNRAQYNFLVDTGSSVTLVTPTLAQRFGLKPKNPATQPKKEVAVRSSDGEIAKLESVTLKKLELEEVLFENVPALIYDCNAISAHLGIRIDGILGFPIFRELLFTMDYPQHRAILASPRGAITLQPGESVSFNNDQRTPIIPLSLGDKIFIALIDTGSDSSLRFNPVGFDHQFAVAPKPGPIVSSLTGDRQQTVARLGEDVRIGPHIFEKPIVELTDELSAIGGSALNQFAITFDQEHNRVTFFRESRTPIKFPSTRSAGISFSKAGAYWRVAGVVPNSPAAKAGIEAGDLIVRINQEPVEQWATERFNALVRDSNEIAFAFLVGKREYELKLKVMVLIP